MALGKEELEKKMTMRLSDKAIGDFVRESNAIENILRDPTLREIDVHQFLLRKDVVTVADVCDFVNVVGGGLLRVSPWQNVSVGNHHAPPGGEKIVKALTYLLDIQTRLTPLQLHDMYLWMHPFMDGNGRSARLLWLRATLNSPDKGMPARYGFLRSFYYQKLTEGDPNTKLLWASKGWEFPR